MEKVSYIESEDKLVIQTIYDTDATFKNNAALRTDKPVTVGSKGQELMLAASIPMEHITALKNIGYDLLSPDPAEFRRALCYIQSEQSKFMTVDGKPFAMHRPKWE